MKNFLLRLSKVLLTSTFFSTFADSNWENRTVICMYNFTESSYVIGVENIDNHDWEGKDRPDANFKGWPIRPEQRICYEEVMNGYVSTVYFNFTFNESGHDLSARMSNSNRSEELYWRSDLDSQFRNESTSIALYYEYWCMRIGGNCTTLVLAPAIKGTYLKTCRNVDFYNGTLSAICTKYQESGEIKTKLDYLTCANNSTVSNLFGNLSCDKLGTE